MQLSACWGSSASHTKKRTEDVLLSAFYRISAIRSAFSLPEIPTGSSYMLPGSHSPAPRRRQWFREQPSPNRTARRQSPSDAHRETGQHRAQDSRMGGLLPEQRSKRRDSGRGRVKAPGKHQNIVCVLDIERDHQRSQRQHNGNARESRISVRSFICGWTVFPMSCTHVCTDTSK